MKKVFTILTFIYLALALTSCVQSGQNTFLSSSDKNTLTFFVMDTNPAGGESISYEQDISFKFSKYIDDETISVNVLDSICRGSVQLSCTGFSSCLRIMKEPYKIGDYYYITPYDGFPQGKSCQLRVTTDIQDQVGNSLPSTYSTSSFYISTSDSIAPTVAEIDPADSSVNVNENSEISVQFSEPMLLETLTINTADSRCTGSIQVSSDNFITCVEMATTPIPSVGKRKVTVRPSVPLLYGNPYKVKVLSTVKDSHGNSMASDFTQSTGFSVFIPRKVRITWDASPEKTVNSVGGGYRVYYSLTEDFELYTATYQNVPYVSGTHSPTMADIEILSNGTWYFKIISYSTTSVQGSEPSQEVSVEIQ